MSVEWVNAAADTSVYKSLTIGAGFTVGWILRCEFAGPKVMHIFSFADSASVALETVVSVVIPHQVTGRAMRLSFFLQPHQYSISQLLNFPLVGKYVALVHISSISNEVHCPFACLLAIVSLCKLSFDIICPFFSQVSCFVLCILRVCDINSFSHILQIFSPSLLFVL